MKDGLQGISFDRWLMRIKDILQIAVTLAAILFGGYKYLRTVEMKDAEIMSLQNQLIEIREQSAKK